MKTHQFRTTITNNGLAISVGCGPQPNRGWIHRSRSHRLCVSWLWMFVGGDNRAQTMPTKAAVNNTCRILVPTTISEFLAFADFSIQLRFERKTLRYVLYGSRLVRLFIWIRVAFAIWFPHFP